MRQSIWKLVFAARLKARIVFFKWLENKFGMTHSEKRVLRAVLKAEIQRHFKTDVPDAVIDRVWMYFFTQHIFIRRPLDPFETVKRVTEMEKKYASEIPDDGQPLTGMPEVDVDEK